MATEETRTTDGYGCAAVICTAVVTETKSIRQTFGGHWHRFRVKGDKQHYYETTFTDKNGQSQRVITCQQDVMGMSAASALATKAAVGLDMESYAVFLASSLTPNPKPKALVVKSVCDYANE